MRDHPKEANSPRTVKSVETLLRIVEYLEAHGKASLTEIATQVDLSKSGVHHHLLTLKEGGYVTKIDGKYMLSLRFLNVGKNVQTSRILYQEAKPIVDDLAQECGEYVHLVVEEDGRSIYLYKATGQNAVGRHFPAGEREYLHHSAAGKSILAHMTEARVREIVEEHGLLPLAENTITEYEALQETLKTIREQGYSYNREEEIKGINAVGAPILDENDEIVAAMSVSGPKTRLTGDTLERIRNLVQEKSNIVQINLSVTDKSANGAEPFDPQDQR